MIVNIVSGNSGAQAPVTPPQSSSPFSNAWYTAGAWTRIAVFMPASMVAIIAPWLVIRWIVDCLPTHRNEVVVMCWEGV